MRMSVQFQFAELLVAVTHDAAGSLAGAVNVNLYVSRINRSGRYRDGQRFGNSDGSKNFR